MKIVSINEPDGMQRVIVEIPVYDRIAMDLLPEEKDRVECCQRRGKVSDDLLLLYTWAIALERQHGAMMAREPN